MEKKLVKGAHIGQQKHYDEPVNKYRGRLLAIETVDSLGIRDLFWSIWC